MTKLVVVLAAVVVVILVVVIVAARNMRAEDPDEFADGPDHRDLPRGGLDGRGVPYQREPAAMRAPARAGREARGPAARGGADARAGARLMTPPPGRNGRASGNGRRFDDRDEQWSDSRDEPTRAYSAQPDAPGNGYDDHLSGPLPAVPAAQRRRPDSTAARDGRSTGPQRRPEQATPPPVAARPARSRRSSDSSEWDSSDWDKLSDVDYWAELASDKPLTTTAQPAASARPARPAQRSAQRQPATDPGAETQALGRGGSRSGGSPRRDPGDDPTVRSRRQPGRAEPASAGRRPDIAAAGSRGGSAAMLPAPPDQHLPRHSGPPSLPPPGSLPGPASLPETPRTAGPPSLPRGVPAGPGSAPARGRRRADPDDDPLTSPSFPHVPGDSRSYRNGRSEISSRGAASPQQYPPAPTEQFSSYPSAPQRPAAHYGASASGASASRPAHGADPYGYQSAPDAYPGAGSAAPATRAGAAGNPYGSYVTPDSPSTSSGYNGYSASHGNGSGYLPPAPAAAALTDDYWTQQRRGSGASGAGTSGYPDDPRQSAASRAGAAPEPGYGYGQQDPAGYQPGGYPAGSGDAAGYPPQEEYRGEEREPGPPRPGSTGYGGYPGYGTSR